GLQAATLMLFVLIYILFTSQIVIVTIVLLSAIAVPFYLQRNNQVITSTQEATVTRVRLFGALNDLLHGFKEIRLRQTRGEDLQREYNAIAEATKDATVRALVREQELHGFISANFYLLLAFVVFVLPRWVTSGPGSLQDVTAAVLFLLGPLGVLSFTLPQYERASLAAESLQALEARLEPAAPATALSPGMQTPQPPAQLCEVNNI
ncbi:hypothetical protein, partial [Haliangium sp. UPWRP_2]|uniref:hypothetical protein n=1 Tax=Haliangium sp. UPWRP_2 TaxID=1931276 RepID=UPI001E361B3C